MKIRASLVSDTNTKLNKIVFKEIDILTGEIFVYFYIWVLMQILLIKLKTKWRLPIKNLHPMHVCQCAESSA